MLEKKIAGALLCLMVVVGCSVPQAMGGEILFIVNDPTEATFKNDGLIKDILENLGHNVTYFDDGEDEAAMEAAAADADLVYISESVSSNLVYEKITEIETPMIVGEPYAWDEMGMTRGGGGTSAVASTDITIVNPSHPLAAGLSGTVPVLTDIAGAEGTAEFAMGAVGGDGTVIATATLADGQTYDVIIVYEKGAALAATPTDGSGPYAADIRIGMFFHYYAHDVLNENGIALVEAAVKYIFGVKPQARKPEPRDGSYHPEVWASLKWWPGDLAVSHDVYLGDNFDDVNAGAESTFQGNKTETSLVVGFPGFPYPEGLVPGTTYYWRVDAINENEPNSPWIGHVWSFTIPPKTAYNPQPADGAESVDLNMTLTWTGGFGAKLHTVFFSENFDDVNDGLAGTPRGTATYNPGPLEIAKTYYWRVDEFDGFDTYEGEIWSFTAKGTAANPNPANGAVDVSPTPMLKWSPGNLAASHELYFGADSDAVSSAGKSSPEYKGTRALGDESYDAGILELETTYYWRIDEVNSAEPGSPWVGRTWSFTTGDFLVVDDFESYNDIDPPDPASNRIFDKWIDGFGTTTNGALVGNDLPPYAEQAIVRSGAQAMIYRYDNASKTSEATLTVVYPRDWTAEGVTKLSLWFRGASANAADRMFVALNDSAVVYHSNPAPTQTLGWVRWIIDLQEFANQGVALANVNTITIGIGTKNSPAAGGAGTMYFDDIRLDR